MGAIVESMAIEDIKSLQQCADAFFPVAGLRGSFNMGHFEQCWQTYYALGIGKIMVVRHSGRVVAAMGCLRVPDLYTGEMVASEVFWFVLPEHRGVGLALLDAYEKWARDEGCREVRMIHLSGLMPERLKALYQRRGYCEVEVAYGKEA